MEGRYAEIIHDPKRFLAEWLEVNFAEHPELFPPGFANGYEMSRRYHAKRLGINIRRITLRDGTKYQKNLRIILDNLNTHTKGALYKCYPSDYAREILHRCEFIYTPIHGSWLNIAESELSVLTKQCLCRRLGDISEVRRQVAAWTAWQNTHAKGVHWQFTTDDARIKLASVYPKFQFDVGRGERKLNSSTCGETTSDGGTIGWR